MADVVAVPDGPGWTPVKMRCGCRGHMRRVTGQSDRWEFNGRRCLDHATHGDMITERDLRRFLPRDETD